MATESITTREQARLEKNGECLDIHRNVLDLQAATTLFKVRSILALGIEATMDQDRMLHHWPNIAETVWDMLDEIMVRAGLSDGTERPWVSANETKVQA